MRTSATGRMCVQVLALAASACGGGGSGGAAPGVSIQPVQPSSVQAAVNVGDRAPLVQFRIGATGDLSQLEGETLYVLVEDAGGITEGDPDLSIMDTAAGIGLLGKVLDEVGPRSGSLVFHACLDPACERELAGSPTTATYSFDVRPGLVVDAPELIELTAAFGEDLAPLEIPVTLPVGATSLEVEPTLCDQDYWIPALMDTGGCSSSALGLPVASTTDRLVVRLDPGVGWPGVYTETVRMQARTLPGGSLRVHERTITVRYTITSEGGPDALFFWSPEFGGPSVLVDPVAGIHVEVADGIGHELQLGAYAKAGIVSWDRVEYSGNVPPVGADPDAPYDDWFWMFNRTIGACRYIGQDRRCMAPGDYAAVVHGHVDDGGAGIPISVPVAMRVGPIP